MKNNLEEFASFSDRNLVEVKSSYRELVKIFLTQFPDVSLLSKEGRKLVKEGHKYAFARIGTYKYVSKEELEILASFFV